MKREPDSRAAIGAGSNLGDRLEHLRFAVSQLTGLGEEVSTSSVWETAPIGPEQPDYLNGVLVLDTLLGPRPLLARCFEIERSAGRSRRERWGPRVLDLDLLVYGDAVLEAPGLSVPHPRLGERRFVLEPLAEVWPGLEVPGHGLVEDLLSTVSDQIVHRTDLTW
jgi:2-amino-4-hydroxy-6-hydroxymethyldihydropteridine diphosphokinase